MAAERNILSRKLVLLGDTAVGKSCLAVRFVRDEFYDYQEPTIGASFLQQSITLDHATIKFEIWDTAGQERYRSLAPMYYRGAAAAVVVFDVTNKETFEGAKTWVTELKRKGDPGVTIALAGNKCDLPERNVDRDEAVEYAKAQGIMYMDVSAKSNTNIKEMFVSIAKALPKASQADNSDLVDLMSKPEKKKGCC